MRIATTPIKIGNSPFWIEKEPVSLIIKEAAGCSSGSDNRQKHRMVARVAIYTWNSDMLSLVENSPRDLF